MRLRDEACGVQQVGSEDRLLWGAVWGCSLKCAVLFILAQRVLGLRNRTVAALFGDIGANVSSLVYVKVNVITVITEIAVEEMLGSHRASNRHYEWIPLFISVCPHR